MTKRTELAPRPTLDDVLARVPEEHRAPLAFMRSQMPEAEAAIIEGALPALFAAIGERDYTAFEAGMVEVGYGHFAYMLWTLLDPGDPDADPAADQDAGE